MTDQQAKALRDLIESARRNNRGELRDQLCDELQWAMAEIHSLQLARRNVKHAPLSPQESADILNGVAHRGKQNWIVTASKNLRADNLHLDRESAERVALSFQLAFALAKGDGDD